MTATDRPLKLLLACEFYHPSRGGVQEVMRQLAEHFVAAGHDVTVATTRLPERDFAELNGVKIAEFAVAGKRATGISGEADRYAAYLAAFDGDALLIKAAQQWTFDAAWPALDRIKARKVFIPCGFSCLYEPSFARYFEELPPILAKFDALIFYAEHYRDVDYARAHGLTRLHFLPNGASETEFAAEPAPGIRARLGVPDDALLVMTVGTPINAKGHTELAEAFSLLQQGERPLALLLNGQWPERPRSPATEPPADPSDEVSAEVLALTEPEPPGVGARAAGFVGRARRTLADRGVGYFLRRAGASLAARSRGFGMRGAEALLQTIASFRKALKLPATPPPPPPKTIDDHIAAARAQTGKTVIKSNLPRRELVEAFFAADLFVFASNVEYSPLVLFEAGAAGLPYLTVPVGNADEIVRWTGGGELCAAAKDERGYTRADPVVLARRIQDLLDDPGQRARLGTAGRAAWQRTYNWAAIAPRYEAILRGDARPRHD